MTREQILAALEANAKYEAERYGPESEWDAYEDGAGSLHEDIASLVLALLDCGDRGAHKEVLEFFIKKYGVGE